MHPSFSDRLEAALQPYRDDYRKVVAPWITSGLFAMTYPAFLVETYHYVKHSCSLMQMAEEGLDEVYRPLKAYLHQHIKEEFGHEEWILDDLEYLGYDRAEVALTSPLPETINVIGSQQYVIQYLHPAGLMGYVYLMESTPPTVPLLNHLQEHLLIPEGAMKFLTTHGELDIRHRLELKEVLDSYIDTDIARQAVTISATSGLSNVTALLARLASGRFTDSLPLRI